MAHSIGGVVRYCGRHYACGGVFPSLSLYLHLSLYLFLSLHLSPYLFLFVLPWPLCCPRHRFRRRPYQLIQRLRPQRLRLHRSYQLICRCHRRRRCVVSAAAAAYVSRRRCRRHPPLPLPSPSRRLRYCYIIYNQDMRLFTAPRSTMGKYRVVANCRCCCTCCRRSPSPLRMYSGRQVQASLLSLPWQTPPLGGLGQGKILGEEGIGVRVLEVDQNAASVLLQGAYHWVRDQDLSSQRKDT